MVVSYLPDVMPDVASFARLFDTTGWNAEYQLTPAAIHEAASNSWYLDMIVDPAYQGRGIGSRILEMMNAHAAAHGIRDLQLFSARGKDGFYRRHGFTIRPDAAPGMEIKRSGSGFGDRP